MSKKITKKQQEKLQKEYLAKLQKEMIEDAKNIVNDYEEIPGDPSGSIFIDFDSSFLEDGKVFEGSNWKQIVKPQFIEILKKSRKKNKKE
jgi:hypothetical protein